MTPPDARDRLIVALDVPDADQAKALVQRIGDAACHYKLGLELAMTPDYFGLVDWLAERGCQVFCDLKLHDIPATVGRAVARLSATGAQLVTIHAGQRAMLEAAADARTGGLQVVAVTALTSLDRGDLDDLGIRQDPDELVLTHTRRALAAGLDGVVCSGHEAARLLSELGQVPLVITPGIRPDTAGAPDDQKRVMTPAQAIAAGASHIVVGRPVRDADDPAAAAAAIVQQIEAARAA